MEVINLPKLTTEDTMAMPLAITTSQDKVLVALEAAAEAWWTALAEALAAAAVWEVAWEVASPA